MGVLGPRYTAGCNCHSRQVHAWTFEDHRKVPARRRRRPGPLYVWLKAAADIIHPGRQLFCKMNPGSSCSTCDADSRTMPRSRNFSYASRNSMESRFIYLDNAVEIQGNRRSTSGNDTCETNFKNRHFLPAHYYFVHCTAHCPGRLEGLLYG